MPVGQAFSVLGTGIGKPDYSREIHAARERAGIVLKYNQQMKVFGVTFTDMVVHPYEVPWVQPPLAPGAQGRLYDVSTGLIGPYTIPVGYTLTMFQKDWTGNQDLELWLYQDGLLVACPGISPSGANIYFNTVWPSYSSAVLDPAGVSAHTFDILVVNVGGADLEGGITVVAILEAVGTPPWPTTKKCQCPFCHHIQEVPVGTTNITCEGCGKLYIVYDFSKIRQL